MPLFAGPVAQVKFHDLDRVLRGDKNRHLRAYTVPAVDEAGVPPAVDDFILAVAGPERHRQPQISALLVPEVAHFAGVIENRVVGPGSEFEFPAVFPPGVSGAQLRNDAAEPRVGGNIYPWSRQMMITILVDNLVFRTVKRETSPPVKEQQF